MVSGCCELYNDHLKIPHKGEFVIMIMNFTPPQSSAGGSVKMVQCAYFSSDNQELYTDIIDSNTIICWRAGGGHTSSDLRFAPGRWQVCAVVVASNTSYHLVSCAEFVIDDNGTLYSVTEPNDLTCLYVSGQSNGAYATLIGVLGGNIKFMSPLNNVTYYTLHYFVKVE